MKKILLIIPVAIMLFATACSKPISESNNSQITKSSQPSAVSGTTVFDKMPEDISSTAESTQKTETSESNPEISNTVTVSDQKAERSTDKEENDLSIDITVNGCFFSATLYDNETAKAFKARLPLALEKCIHKRRTQPILRALQRHGAALRRSTALPTCCSTMSASLLRTRTLI